MDREIYLGKEGEAPQKLMDLELLETELQTAPDQEHFYVCLTDAQNQYLAIHGKFGQLTISCGKARESEIQHFLFYLSKRDETELSITMGKKAFSVRSNEILTVDDAAMLAKCFSEHVDFPPAYNLRQLKEAIQ